MSLIGIMSEFWIVNLIRQKRLISEMIHIKEQKNGLNYMSDIELLDECYFDILNVFANSEK